MANRSRGSAPAGRGSEAGWIGRCWTNPVLVLGAAGCVLIWVVASDPSEPSKSRSRMLVGAREPVRLVRVSLDGTNLAAASADQVIVSESGRLRTLPMDVELGASPLAMDWSPSGAILAICDRPGGPIWFWGTADEAPPAILDGVRGDRLEFLADGRLAIGTSDRELVLADPDSGAVLDRLALRDSACLLASSPDGRYIAFATWPDNDAGGIGVWDRRTGESLLRERAHRIAVTALAFSEDGTSLYTAGSDRLIRRWDRSSLDSPRAEVERSHTIYSLVALPGRGELAMGDSCGSITIADARTLLPSGSVREHSATVTSLQAMPDGRSLVSGSLDHTVRLWDLDAIAPPAGLPVDVCSSIAAE
ncbi:WD40 repeat domain-containing protein [Tautonia sociabilis]|uniref:Uncharacterized protein n=1 Tax=Tautonia sociabilis TaxID=2080755 RepID=A0A432MPH2_9BACT|nr:hypothetical protein [Tautonia sociabilis]RUL89312.1 hypothetical protein TsocGM_02530 [Tautonia sociabilis]